MKFRCIVNLNKSTVHITNDADIDIFEDIHTDEKWTDTVARLGYKTEDLGIHIIGDVDTPKSKHKVVGVSDIIRKEALSIVSQIGAEKFIDKYRDAFCSLSENAGFSTNPSIMKDCALCKKNYPEGVDILLTIREEDTDKAKALFNSMVSDIDMLTDDMLDFKLSINTI